MVRVGVKEYVSSVPVSNMSHLLPLCAWYERQLSLFTIAKRGNNPPNAHQKMKGPQNVAYPYNGIFFGHTRMKH